MLGAGGVGGDEGQVDVALHRAGQLDLRLLGGFLQALRSHLVLTQIDAVLLLEGIGHPVDDALVEVIAAQMGIAVGCQNLGNAVAHLNDGHIEGAAAQVVHHDLLVGLFIHTVGQAGGGGLVDDTLHVQAGDGACVLGGLTLAVIEVSGHGDDGLGDRLAQVSLGVRLQLGQNHGADLLRGVGLAVDGDLFIGAHLPLDGRNGAVGVGNGLALCNLADQTLTGLGEAHDGRSGASAFGVRNHNGLAALDNGNTAVGGAKVNANNLTHNLFAPLICNFGNVFVWVVPSLGRRGYLLFRLGNLYCRTVHRRPERPFIRPRPRWRGG